jgi:hypothetical protein
MKARMAPLTNKRAKTGTQTPQFGLPASLLGFGGRTDGAAASQGSNPNKIPVAVENEKGDNRVRGLGE